MVADGVHSSTAHRSVGPGGRSVGVEEWIVNDVVVVLVTVAVFVLLALVAKGTERL